MNNDIGNLSPTDVVNYSRSGTTTISAQTWTTFGNSGKVFSKGLWIITGYSYLYGSTCDRYIRLELYKSDNTIITTSDLLHVETTALEGQTILMEYVPENDCYCLLKVYNYVSGTVGGCRIKGIKLRN